MIVIEIPEATPTLNLIKKMHWQPYARLRKHWCILVLEALHGERPKNPIQKCEIYIERHGSRSLDWDNLYGGFKPLLDCLVVATSANPSGLGIIQDDNTNIVTSLIAKPVKCKRKEEKTIIEIQEI